ncbi:MAG: alpha/beta hydrolase [Clostridia bacterium]|nr:alpha/beta hydrolase [Clostridia bacterium]
MKEENKKTNKIYIVHCWDGTKEDGWYPWLDKELSNDDNIVYRFNMPNTNIPKIDEWVSFLDKQVDELDENTYFIGHSIGCQTIMRYLQTKDICKIGGILFVAPWLDLLYYAISDEESYNTAKPWLTENIDFEKIKKFTNNINCIFSDDDYFVSLEQKDKFEKLLNANTVVVRGKGHISQEDNVYELKEILDECKKMIK